MLWDATGEQQAEPAATAQPALFAWVALDTPVRREFSYRVPEPCSGVDLGCRVRVPFGNRDRIGVVVGLDRHPPEDVPLEKLRALDAQLDQAPLLTPALLRLARQIADSTFCSWGSALAAMLPAALRRDRPRRTIPVVSLERAPTAEEREELARRFPKQEKALAYLEIADGPVPIQQFQARTGLSRSPLESLRKRGFVRFDRERSRLDPFRGVAQEPDTPPVATPDQQLCIDAVVQELELGRHAAFLLFGITGSGKTEVYLRALERCLAAGRGAIILVPEIALTPQTVSRFRARCGDVAVLHSGLTDAERHDQWVAIREGRQRIVVGARSALFAPVERLGLIVVDEEHESSFKQESTPRYHARDVALERCRLEGAVCVLGSATPALESWRAAQTGRVHRLELADRVAGGRLPRVEVVDMRTQKPDKGHWLVISEPLRRELAGALERGERAILFLNQRGFAPAWHCRACGGSVHCERCDVALTYHRWRKRALCHYCLQEAPPPERCEQCNGPVSLVGIGTERAEDTVSRLFPQARLARMDRDTMLRRESYERVLGDFAAGRVDILLGTQMVAKGLDIPEVTVVGVLNADTALHHPDFRASERCFNLIAQVSGRAGRGERPGTTVVQTWMPEHPAIQAAIRHDYPGFAQRELAERREFGYPPYTRALRILFEGRDAKQVETRSEEFAARLRAVAGRSPAGCRAQVLGPAPPPVERLRGRVRRQILLKIEPLEAVTAFLPALYDLCQKPGATVDPL